MALTLVGDDGLAQPPTHEEMVSAGLVLAVAAAGVFIACAAVGYVVYRFFGIELDKAWDREYWVQE